MRQGGGRGRWVWVLCGVILVWGVYGIWDHRRTRAREAWDRIDQIDRELTFDIPGEIQAIGERQRRAGTYGVSGGEDPAMDKLAHREVSLIRERADLTRAYPHRP